jgi:phosphate transport system protein
MHEKKLNDLKGKIIQFSSHIEHMKDRSIRGLVNRDADMLHAVIERDEPQANVIELDIEEICITLIAQYQPMAKDLRTILVIYNMSNTLERMADHAVNIARNALELIGKPPIKPFLDIPRMGEIVRTMLDNTINAFINEDAGLARSVCEQDHIIDALRDQIVRELITFMTGNAHIVGACINIMQIAENLERIGDLATNICEDVIFMSQGTVIKHYKDAQAAKQ